MKATTLSATAALAAAAVLALQGPAVARSRHRHPHAAVVPAAPAGSSTQARDPAEFYPERIEGGVRGNLAFNNQIRKLKDPLNANGGGG